MTTRAVDGLTQRLAQIEAHNRRLKQQQRQIKRGSKKIETLKKQQQEIEAMRKKLVCADRLNASICKSN